MRVIADPAMSNCQALGVQPRLVIALLTAVLATVWQRPATFFTALALLCVAVWREKTFAPFIAWLRLLPFAALLCLPLALYGGLSKVGLALLRLSVSSLAIAWSINGASEAAVLRALRSLRLPALLVAVIAMILRYLCLLREEALRMQLAQRARLSNSANRWEACRRAVGIVGTLMSRATQRSERIYLAMLSRGCGSLECTPPSWRLPARSWLALGFACGLLAALTAAEMILL